MVFHNGALELGLFETWTLESIMPDLIRRKHRRGRELQSGNAEDGQIL